MNYCNYEINTTFLAFGTPGTSTWSEFLSRPNGFQFLPQDVFEVTPVVKHNLPFLPFAEGMLVALKAAVLSLSLSVGQTDESPHCCLL